MGLISSIVVCMNKDSRFSTLRGILLAKRFGIHNVIPFFTRKILTKSWTSSFMPIILDPALQFCCFWSRFKWLDLLANFECFQYVVLATIIYGCDCVLLPPVFESSSQTDQLLFWVRLTCCQNDSMLIFNYVVFFGFWRDYYVCH